MCQSNDSQASVSVSKPLQDVGSPKSKVVGTRHRYNEAYPLHTSELVQSEEKKEELSFYDDAEEEAEAIMRAQISQQLHDQAVWWNEQLSKIDTAVERIQFILRHANDTNTVPTTHKVQQRVIQTTSFGIQSCLMLDLLHKAKKQQVKDPTITDHPSIVTSKVPILWIDTGYLPHETYQFAEELEHRYDLDLHVYQSPLSPARMEALHGEQLWHTDHTMYNQIRKVEPMQRALQDTHATMILTGLRSAQTSHRQSLQLCNVEWDAATHTERLKFCPILDWSDTDVSAYFAQHSLPYHPLYYFNYRSVGDAHSSEPYDPSVHANERETRFHGKAQECGLHMSITSFSESSSTSSTTTTRNARDSLKDLQTARRRGLMKSDSQYDRHSWYDDYQSKSIIRLQDILHDDDEEDEEPPIPPPSATGFTIYGRPKCRFCRAAKQLVNALTQPEDGLEAGVPLVTIEVGTEAEESITKDQLEEALGGRSVNTVPQILYQKEYIGGYTDLVEWGRAKYGAAVTMSGNTDAAAEPSEEAKQFVALLGRISVE